MTAPRYALVVLVDGARTAGVWVDGDTCLNHLAILAEFVDQGDELAIFYEVTDAKWVGRGRRRLRDVGQGRLFA